MAIRLSDGTSSRILSMNIVQKQLLLLRPHMLTVSLFLSRILSSYSLASQLTRRYIFEEFKCLLHHPAVQRICQSFSRLGVWTLCWVRCGPLRILQVQLLTWIMTRGKSSHPTIARVCVHRTVPGCHRDLRLIGSVGRPQKELLCECEFFRCLEGDAVCYKLYNWARWEDVVS